MLQRASHLHYSKLNLASTARFPCFSDTWLEIHAPFLYGPSHSKTGWQHNEKYVVLQWGPLFSSPSLHMNHLSNLQYLSQYTSFFFPRKYTCLVCKLFFFLCNMASKKKSKRCWSWTNAKWWMLICHFAQVLNSCKVVADNFTTSLGNFKHY